MMMVVRFDFKSGVVAFLTMLFFTGGTCFTPPSSQCVSECVTEIQTKLALGTLMEGNNGLSLPKLESKIRDRKTTEESFRSICEAYNVFERCLETCRDEADTAQRIRGTYAGIRYICVQRKEEFFANLPCLVTQEETAMKECRKEIGDSLNASNGFHSFRMNEQYAIRQSFDMLCTSLREMVDCVEPITRERCGDGPARMMLNFIRVGFRSFETIYTQLRMADHIPQSCSKLMATDKTIDMQHEPFTDAQSPFLPSLAALTIIILL